MVLQAVAWVVGTGASGAMGACPVHLPSGRGIQATGFLPSVASLEPRPVRTGSGDRQWGQAVGTGSGDGQWGQAVGTAMGTGRGDSYGDRPWGQLVGTGSQ